MNGFKFLIICLLSVQTARSGAEVPRIDESVHFKRIGDAIIVVPVTLNGRGPFQFVLDTGTDSSIIDTRLAQQLGFNAVDQLTLSTAAGQKTVSRIFVQTASVGRALGRDMELLATNLDSVFPGSSVQGVLGQNFLQAFDLFLEYRKGIVTFLAPGAAVPIGGVHVPISLEHGRPALPWKISADRELRLLLDSGSSSLTVFRTDIPDFQRCILQTCRRTVTTSVSATSAFSGMMPTLVIGDACLHDVAVTYMAQPANGDEIDGMMPTALFNSVYINNHEHFAIVSGAAPSP